MNSEERPKTDATGADSQPLRDHSQSRLWLLCLGALGVVFGDIGTSPLYAMRECFVEPAGYRDGVYHPEHILVQVNHGNVLGVLSLIIWTITIMITVKYVYLVMKADKRGEGGILALMCVAFPERKGRYRSGTALAMVALGVFGAALLYGDGIITPAISVLSAVEGLKQSAPSLEHYIVPITVGILLALFGIQRFGTGKVGAAFGPITALWFSVLAVLGGCWLVQNLRSDSAPNVLQAFNPWLGIQMLFQDLPTSIKVLSGVFLTVTGGEALYADMGHFGLRPIKRTWLGLVKPALLLIYLGQGAFLLSPAGAATSSNPLGGIANPLQLMTPEWGRLPLTLLATAATVIASQALISGVYSLTMQAVQLGYLPRVKIDHTSHMEHGQIYIGRVNWVLMIGCIALVVGFGSSQRLAAAYGIAVATTMLITTLLLYYAARRKWDWSPAKSLAAIAVPVVLSAIFVAANGMKFLHGGWVPMLIGIVLFSIMMTWRTGRRVLSEKLFEQALPLKDFIASVERGGTIKVAGTAVYMAGTSGITPTALLHNLKHNKVLHQRIIFLTIDSETVPYVKESERLTIEQIADGMWRVVGHYGFMERPDVPVLLEQCAEKGLKFVPMQTSYFLGRETIIPGKKSMAYWRAKLFSVLSRNAQSAVAYYNLPPSRVVEFGIQIEL